MVSWKLLAVIAFAAVLLIGIGIVLVGFFPGLSSDGGSSGAYYYKSADYETGGYYAPSSGGVANLQAAGAVNYPSPSAQKLIKIASASIEVPQGTIEERFAKLKNAVTSKGGQVLSADYSETEVEKNYYVTVKIKPSEFENLAQTLKTIGTVKNMNSNVQDVTNEYVDLEIRISNLEKQRIRLVNLLERNGTLSDILAVENELNRVQTQIEIYQAQKLSMDRKIDLSTVTISLYEPAPMVDKNVLQPVSQVGNVFLGALGFAIIAVSGIFGFAIPVLIVGGIVFILYKKVYLKFFGEKPIEKEKKK